MAMPTDPSVGQSGTYIHRSIAASVQLALTDTPVVVVNGARQVGKTTLVRSLTYPGTVEMVSLDDEATRRVASDDPRGFLDRQVDTLVIDEAQLEPRLFRAIKASVDRDRRPARFVVTGSSRLLSAPDMADSLVGRVEIHDLMPFSQGEIAGVLESFVDCAFDTPELLRRSGSLRRAELFERVVAGGYPEIVTRAGGRRRSWFEAYIRVTVDKVVREIAELERLAEIPKLVALCAARTSTELNVAELASVMAIPPRTASAYLARLRTAFLIDLVPAWSTNVSARVVRKPKLAVVDSGLAASLTGVGPSSDPNLIGPLLETFVVSELRKQIAWSEGRPTMWHYRDRRGPEVDVVLERRDGAIVGVEVKATSSPSRSDAAGLRLLADRFGDRFKAGIVLSACPDVLPFGEKVVALPVSALWEDYGGVRS